ncbi:MAG: sensor histidine kinase [bacterium]|nr:sensor histidine kinase [bacterium]
MINPPQKRLSSAYLNLSLTVIPMLYGLSALVTAQEIVERLALPGLLMPICFMLLMAVFSYTFFHKQISRLTHLDLVLFHLNQNQEVVPIHVGPHDPLKPLIDQVNALIQERTTLKTMRGQLYEQISETAAQEERKRLARDLHDSIKQQVFSMSVSAAAAYAHLDTNVEAARQALRDVKQSAHEAMVEMRALLQQLAPAPLEKSGLVGALREQAEALAYRTGAKVDTSFGELPDNQRFPLGAQEAVFRIAQESLSNIARHARAQQVTLKLDQRGEHVMLTITDDGQGFDPTCTENGMGLHNIRARAAAVHAEAHIESAPGKGTRITITLPLVDPALELNRESDARLDALGETYLRWFTYFVVAVCTAAVALPLALYRLVQRPESLAEDPVLAFMVILMIVISIGALPAAVWTFTRARSIRRSMEISTHRTRPAYFKMMRHTGLGFSVIGLFIMWFVPLAWIGSEFPLWFTPLFAVAFSGLMIRSYLRSFVWCTAELNAMPPVQRQAELTRFQALVRTGWGSVAFLLFILVITNTFRNGLQFLPTDPDEWMTTIMVLMGGLLLINQFLNMIYYRRQAVKAAAEVQALSASVAERREV